MSDSSFLPDDVHVSTSTEAVQDAISAAVHPQTFADFQKVQTLETAVATLQRQVTSLHELVSRIIEINVQLKRQSVPTYDPERLEELNRDAGFSAPAAAASDAPKTISLLRNSAGQVVIKGKTFDITDELKRRFGAVWNKGLSAWTCDASHEPQLAAYLRESGFNVV
jgi:paraquat-inducible protein B